VFKGETLKLFTRYWPNPRIGLPMSPAPSGAGALRRRLFFLLDDRYYRYPDRWPDGPDKTMFGARQLEWPQAGARVGAARRDQDHRRRKPVLEPAESLRGMAPVSRPSSARSPTGSLRKGSTASLFSRATGTFSELLRIDRPGAYPLYEFTSSPLTSRPPPRDRRRRTRQSGHRAGNARAETAVRDDPGARSRRRPARTLESHDSDGALLWRHEIRARDLRTTAAVASSERATGSRALAAFVAAA
jgi:alkaline phosphatase D